MAAYKSSSLAVSEGLTRHEGSGLLKNGLFRHSKQHMMEKKMFKGRKGTHGKDLQIGKKFSSSSKSMGDMKSSSISPSTEEFDKMMKSPVTHNMNKKKSMFSRKQFG